MKNSPSSRSSKKAGLASSSSGTRAPAWRSSRGGAMGSSSNDAARSARPALAPAKPRRSPGDRAKRSGDVCFDVLLVDPPRRGLDAATRTSLATYDHVLFVSCNPAALAEDLKALEPTHAVAAAAVVDGFPGTPHCECLVHFARRPRSLRLLRPRRRLRRRPRPLRPRRRRPPRCLQNPRRRLRNLSRRRSRRRPLLPRPRSYPRRRWRPRRRRWTRSDAGRTNFLLRPVQRNPFPLGDDLDNIRFVTN